MAPLPVKFDSSLQSLTILLIESRAFLIMIKSAGRVNKLLALHQFITVLGSVLWFSPFVWALSRSKDTIYQKRKTNFEIAIFSESKGANVSENVCPDNKNSRQKSMVSIPSTQPMKHEKSIDFRAWQMSRFLAHLLSADMHQFLPVCNLTKSENMIPGTPIMPK